MRVVGDGNARFVQTFLGHIQSPQLHIFVHISQDVGQLQSFAQSNRESLRRFGKVAEHAHGQHPDRPRNAAAVQLKLGHRRRAHAVGNVHFHTVNQGDKLVFGQGKRFNGFNQGFGDSLRRLSARIDFIQIVAPNLQSLPLLFQ